MDRSRSHPEGTEDAVVFEKNEKYSSLGLLGITALIAAVAMAFLVVKRHIDAGGPDGGGH
jgi:hypothetical protein